MNKNKDAEPLMAWASDRRLLARALDLLEEAEWDYGEDGACYHCQDTTHRPDCPWLALMQEAGRR